MGDQSTNFAKKYSQNIELLATTIVGEFDGKVAEDFFSGAEELFWEQLGGAAENEVTEANGQQVYRMLEHLRRMVYTKDYELPLMLDKRHEMRTAVDFKSSYVSRVVEAYKRSKAIAIFEGVFGTAYTGKNGTTSTAFDYANQTIPIDHGSTGTDNGLNKEKLITARQMLKQAGYDLKDPRYKAYFSCTSREISDLLATMEATSSDYAIVRSLETGERNDWLGFEFVIGETVPFLTSAKEASLVWAETTKGIRAPVNPQDGVEDWRACFAYVKDVIGCYTSANFTTEAGKIERFRYNWGLYSAWSHGAVRRQEDGIVLVPTDQGAALP